MLMLGSITVYMMFIRSLSDELCLDPYEINISYGTPRMTPCKCLKPCLTDQWEDHLQLRNRGTLVPPRCLCLPDLPTAQGGTPGLKALDNGHKIGQWSLRSTVKLPGITRVLSDSEFWPPLRNFEIGWASDGWSSEDFWRKYKWLISSFKISRSLAVLILDHGSCHASAPGRWCSELYGAGPTWTEHAELGSTSWWFHPKSLHTSDKIRIIWCNVVDNYW